MQDLNFDQLNDLNLECNGNIQVEKNASYTIHTFHAIK